MGKFTNVVFIILLILTVVAVYWFVFKDKPVVNNELKTLSGTVTYRERIALPAGSIVTVEINDVSRADAPALNIASTEIITTGENVPIPFEINYDASKLDSRMSYSVSAKIMTDGQLRFITDTHNSLLDESGNPITSIDLLLVSAHSQLLNTSDKENNLPEHQSMKLQESTDELNGRSYRLYSIDGEILDKETNYIVSFSEGRVAAKFCNNVVGDYISNNGIIKGLMVSTLMYCASPTDIMKIEDQFAVMMNDGAKFTINKNTLSLENGDGVWVLQLTN